MISYQEIIFYVFLNCVQYFTLDDGGQREKGGHIKHMDEDLGGFEGFDY